MDQRKLVIATICRARNKAESDLLQKSLTALAQFKIPVYITDAGSIPEFLEFLRSFPDFRITTSVQGVWPQARNSLKMAYDHGSPFIFYTEPDKFDLFTIHLSTILSGLELRPDTGIHLLARSPQSFATFPAFQQMTETTINNCCAELTQKKIDHTYGPFIINRELIPHLTHLPDAIGWGWRPYAFIRAVQPGYLLNHTEDHFECPIDQRSDDQAERIYRMQQLMQNLEGITSAAKMIS